ncbi:MAG TPA: acyltransferase [Frateuria sp.]|uniref:acyltransferase family protein n=1 Tax=Frateuria sp. TaxID=2211372 RepID=UPI002D7F1272|nr:acyltransferase [Frateuria sp.]HET6804397.1 acyltransferase [Frateuria sp.]
MSVRTSHFRNAEGIRGLACLIVLAVHCSGMFFPATGAYLGGVGKIGVWLFFVLSAFLLTNHLLLGSIDRRRLADYAVARFLRIVPLYLLAVVAYRFLGTAGINNSEKLFQAATLQRGFVHLWTIPVECKFYVLLAVLIIPLALAYRRIGPAWSFVAVAATAAAFAALFPFSATPGNSVSLWWYVPCFLTGVAAAVIYPTLPSTGQGMCTVANVLVIGALVLSTNFFRSLIGGPAEPQWLSNKFIPIGLAWAGLLVLNVDRGGAWSKFWNAVPLQRVGRWSYPIYLFHWLILQLLAHRHRGDATVAAIALASSVAIGAAMNWIVERPLMAARRRYAERVERRSRASVCLAQESR